MKKIISVILVALIFFGLVSCTRRSVNEELDTNDTTIAGDDADKNDSKDFFKTEEKMYEINSKHCSVQFPEKWKDMVETQITETEDLYEITFYAVISQQKIPLYAFAFGNSEEGDIVGHVMTDKGNEKVYIIDLSGAYTDGLSADDEYTYNEMYGAINHIISKLVYDNDMVIS